MEGLQTTDNHMELFDLTTDLRNDVDVLNEFPEVAYKLQYLAKKYKAEKGDDPRIAYYRKMNEKK